MLKVEATPTAWPPSDWRVACGSPLLSRVIESGATAADRLSRGSELHANLIVDAHPIGSVLRQKTTHFDFVANLQGFVGPARALEKMRRSHFEAPFCHLTILRVLDVEVDPHVRIGPIDLCNPPFQHDRLLIIELSRKRMVGHQRHRRKKTEN